MRSPKPSIPEAVTGWSVADYRVARALLESGYPCGTVAAVLRTGSPGFPRRRPRPEGYLQRTVSKAERELRERGSFSVAPPR